MKPDSQPVYHLRKFLTLYPYTAVNKSQKIGSFPFILLSRQHIPIHSPFYQLHRLTFLCKPCSFILPPITSGHGQNELCYQLLTTCHAFFSIRNHQTNLYNGLGGSMGQVVGLPNNSYKPITNTAWVHTRLCKLQKRVHATHSRKFTSCLPMVGGSLWVLLLLPPQKLVAMIQLKYC